jgi:hypothetical protein
MDSLGRAHSGHCILSQRGHRIAAGARWYSRLWIAPADRTDTCGWVIAALGIIDFSTELPCDFPNALRRMYILDQISTSHAETVAPVSGG